MSTETLVGIGEAIHEIYVRAEGELADECDPRDVLEGVLYEMEQWWEEIKTAVPTHDFGGTIS